VGRIYLQNAVKDKCAFIFIQLSELRNDFGNTNPSDLILLSQKNPMMVAEETFVIDTKWKVIDQRHPSDDDLKQMFVYNAYWESSKSMLLYPKTFDQTEKFGTYHKGLPNAHHCKLGFVHVVDGSGKLNMGIGWEVLGKLE
jgi:5-methylcytosine-specific restriction endonuclease McrBC regulatory subunit McrC